MLRVVFMLLVAITIPLVSLKNSRTPEEKGRSNQFYLHNPLIWQSDFRITLLHDFIIG